MSEAPTNAPYQSALTTSYEDRQAARIPGITRRLAVRSTWRGTTVAVFEVAHYRDCAVGVSRQVYLKAFPRARWEERPDECLREALALIHPGLVLSVAVGADHDG